MTTISTTQAAPASPPGRSHIRGELLDQPLLNLTPKDTFSIRDALEGTMVFGRTGCGKTSGSGQTLAKAMLQANMGGLVLCVKADEDILWRKYAHETGREDDLIVISPDGDNCFNFLQAECDRKGMGTGSAPNIVQVMGLLSSVSHGHGGGEGEAGGFWHKTVEQLIRKSSTVNILSDKDVSLETMYRIIVDAATSPQMVRTKAWSEGSLTHDIINNLAATRESLKPDERSDLDLAGRYWMSEWPQLADRTRSIIQTYFTSLADLLLSSPLNRLLCGKTTVRPEQTFDGKIIVVALPVHSMFEVGRMTNIIFKIAFQRALQARVVTDESRPVFLFADECQYLLHPYDALFQSTARSSRCATVYLTQSLAALKSELGSGSEDRVNSLLTNLSTKFFHLLHPETAQYAADTVGRDYTQLSSMNTGGSGEGAASFGLHEHLEYSLNPIEFQRGLKTGGPSNGYAVDAIVHQAGREFQATGTNYARVTFSQHIKAHNRRGSQ